MLVTEAREKGVSSEKLAELDHAKKLALRISTQMERRQQREAGLSALVDIARELTTPRDLETLLLVVTRRARLLFGLDMSYISLVDEGGTRVHAADGHTSTLSVGLQLPAGAGLGSAALTYRAPFSTSDYLADNKIRHSEIIDDVVEAEGLRAMMAVPLSYGTRQFGALYIADRKVRHFTADERSLMSSLGDLVGAAIEKARLLDRLSAEVSGGERAAARMAVDLDGMRELNDIQDELIELVLAGGDLLGLAEHANRRLGGGVRMYDADGTPIATVGDVPSDADAALMSVLMDAHSAREPVLSDDGPWTAPVFAGNEYLGALVVWVPHKPTEQDGALLRAVARVAAVLLLQTGRTALVEGQLRDEFLDDLLINVQRPPERLRSRARRLGIDLDQPHAVVIARPEGGAQGKAAMWASSYARRCNGLKSIRDGCVVFLLPGTDAGAAAGAVSTELSPLLGQPVTVGAAGPVRGPTAVHRGYQEALRCLDAIAVLGVAGRAASARELGFLGVLISDRQDVDGFIDSVIGPVLDYDRQRVTELIRTLDAYFDTGGSPTYAAEKLHVHPNTVARRLDRIRELIGADWQQPEQALDIQLALRLSRIRHVLSERRAPPDEEPPAATTPSPAPELAQET
ncbi:MAG TPA: helix-turn-helix domain-containing protein [Pseudonocardiaceae bacterium]|nr:helix-turn-helix domain-containing protein [Pseudonocardiaceae bacterium]